MTVKDLIRELEKFPGDNEVVLFDHYDGEVAVGSAQTHPEDKEFQTRVMIYP